MPSSFPLPPAAPFARPTTSSVIAPSGQAASAHAKPEGYTEQQWQAAMHRGYDATKFLHLEPIALPNGPDVSAQHKAPAPQPTSLLAGLKQRGQPQGQAVGGSGFRATMQQAFARGPKRANRSVLAPSAAAVPAAPVADFEATAPLAVASPAHVAPAASSAPSPVVAPAFAEAARPEPAPAAPAATRPLTQAEIRARLYGF